MSNHYSQLKKQVKVDPETRSYDFLTKTREKNPRSPNILILGMTLGFHLNETRVWKSENQNGWRIQTSLKSKSSFSLWNKILRQFDIISEVSTMILLVKSCLFWCFTVPLWKATWSWYFCNSFFYILKLVSNLFWFVVEVFEDIMTKQEKFTKKVKILMMTPRLMLRFIHPEVGIIFPFFGRRKRQGSSLGS